MKFAILASITLVVAFFAKHILSKKRRRALPPGPKGWPIIGNLLDMPRETTWLTFADWGRKYGDICSVTVFGRPIIIINSIKVATDMLSSKGSIYSDRPELPMGGELIGWKQALPLVRHGETHRRYRKLFHQLFGTHTATESFHESEEMAVRKLLRTVLAKPQELTSHLRTHVGTVALKAVYGYDVQGDNDQFVHLLDHGMGQFAVATAPGAFLVDLLPILRFLPSWFPGGGFHKKAKVWAKDLATMAAAPYEYAKRQFVAGGTEISFTSTFLTSDVSPDDEHIIKWTASSITAGGFPTRLSSLRVFFLTMSLYPEVQRKAQAEIDAVVGKGRLPGFKDRDNLPYVNALCREVLRFHSVSPTGLPHMAMEDDVHDGYLIPKGALIITNIQNMLHDPQIYSDPDTFNPSRFIGSKSINPEKDIYDFMFGFGRRVCPGRVLADETLFITAVMSLAVFDISKHVDANGVTIEPVLKPLSGSVSQPTPFECSIRIRSAEALALVLSQGEVEMDGDVKN